MEEQRLTVKGKTELETSLRPITAKAKVDWMEKHPAELKRTTVGPMAGLTRALGRCLALWVNQLVLSRENLPHYFASQKWQGSGYSQDPTSIDSRQPIILATSQCGRHLMALGWLCTWWPYWEEMLALPSMFPTSSRKAKKNQVTPETPLNPMSSSALRSAPDHKCTWGKNQTLWSDSQPPV